MRPDELDVPACLARKVVDELDGLFQSDNPEDEEELWLMKTTGAYLRIKQAIHAC